MPIAHQQGQEWPNCRCGICLRAFKLKEAEKAVKESGARITLTFDSMKAKRRFLVGMLDGWGEGLGIDVVWKGDFDKADSMHVFGDCDFAGVLP